ncbi:MAG: TIR domain-containing protein, partial [bacterium]
MPITTPKIFISHAHENKPLVRRLEQELQATGAEVWVDHSGVRLGENLPENISKALAACNLFLLIWSNAASASHWVKLEWTSALSLQKTIIPCCLDETALPALLASLLYVDFRNEELGISKFRRDIELAQQSTSAAPDEPTEELVRLLRHKWVAALPPIWNVPHHRNPNFTGREELLQNLRTALASKQSAALTQAIHGLGGVGKTQLAVEYAYRLSHEYEAVWWLAAESPATLAADYAALAKPLALPEKEAADQNLAIAAVRDWLNHHDGWLLVFDNAPEVEALHGYLPQAATGHVLITSRNPNWRSLAQPLAVSTFAPDE